MVVDRKFPRYPNYTFLQLEEINQTLYNYARNGFDDWYCVELSKVYDKYNLSGSSGFNDLRYDFVLISMEKTGSIYKWIFEVRNVFWTGNWRITNNLGEIISEDNYDVSYGDNPAGNVLIVSGVNFKNFNICFQLSPEDKVRKINHTSIRFEKNYEYSHQFDQDQIEEVKLLNASTGNPIANATVTLVPLDHKKKLIPQELETKQGYNFLKHYTTTTNDKGIARIKFNKTITVGKYYARLEAVSPSGNTCFTSVTDDRIQNYVPEPVIEPEPEPFVDKSGRTIEVPDLHIFKGEIKTFKIQVIPKNKYGVVYKPQSEKYVVDIYHTYDQAQNVPNAKVNQSKMKTDKYTFTTDANGYVECKINSRGFYGDYSYLKIVLPKTTTFEQVVTEEYTIKHDWLYIQSYNALKRELEAEDGADAVVLSNATHTKNSADTIQIKRKQFILGEKGNSYPTIDGNYYTRMFTVKSGTNATKELLNELTINGVRIIKCNNVITQENNTNITLTGCVFQENKFEQTGGQGNTVYQNDRNCFATIDHCYFENNYGNCILARGNIIIDANLFKITDVKYTIQPEPFVLEQYDGIGTLTNNQIYVNTSMIYKDGKREISRYNKNRSYAKISVWVGKPAKVNGKGVSELKGDNTFNFFDKPYNNKAYIFSIYYYPYGNVKTYIVASAWNNRINNATGHSVEGVNWAWKDGYNLVRESSKNYNTNNPFVTIKNGRIIEDNQIYVPVSGGVVTLPKDNLINKTRSV